MALSERQLTSREKALKRAEDAGYLAHAVSAEPPQEDQYTPEDLSEMTREMSDGILDMLNVADGEIIRDSYEPTPGNFVRHSYLPGDDGKTHDYWRTVESFSREVLEVRTGPFTLNGQTVEPLLQVTTPGNGEVPQNGRQAFATGVKILSKIFLGKPAPQA